MGATLVKSVMLKITSDDGDTESKLARISAQADDLSKKHPELTARINTAAASAKLKVLKAELSDTGQQATETGGRFSALKEAVNGLTLGLPSGYGEMNMLQKAIVAANLATGVAEPAVAGLTVMVGGLAAGAAAAGIGLGVFGAVAKTIWTKVTTAVTAYQTAQTAVGSATTAKARLAALGQEKTALAGLTGDQQALAFQIMGTESAWKRFTSAASPGVTGIISQGLSMIPRVLSLIKPFLQPVELAISTLLTQLQGGLWSKGLQSFLSLLAGNAGGAILKFGTAVGHIGVGIGGILKAFMPVSQGILSGVDRITAKFALWGSTLSGHSGFKSLETMAKTDAPLLISALTKLGGIAKIVGSQMSSMTSFGNSKQFLLIANAVLQLVSSLLKAHPQLVYLALYAKLGADSLGKMKTAITGVKGGISDVKSVATAFGDLKKGAQGAAVAEGETASAWQNFGGTLAGLGGKIKGAGAGAKAAAASVGSGIASGLSSAKAGVISLGSSIGSGLKTAFLASGSAIKAGVLSIKEWGIWSKVATLATKVWTGIQIAFDAVMDANPITIIVIAVIALIAVIVLLAVKFKPVRDFFKAAWHDIVAWTVDAWHGIVAAFDAIVKAVSAAVSTVIDWVKSHWKLIVAIFTGPIGMVVMFIVTHWNQIVTVTKNLITSVISFFKSLPGKIIGALGNVGRMLWNAGANIIKGLIGGIKSMIGDVTKAVGGIASEIIHHFPLSPAKKGPLSGAGDPMIAGAKITARLAAGMAGSTGAVTAAAGRVAMAAGVTGGGLAGALAGGGTLHVDTSNSDPIVRALVTALQEHIRVTFGGDVQKALGRGKSS